MTKEEFDEYYKDVIDCVKSIIGDDTKNYFYFTSKYPADIYYYKIEKDYWSFIKDCHCYAYYKVCINLYADSTFILYCGDCTDEALFGKTINTCNNEGKRYSNEEIVATITEFLKTNIPKMETVIAEHKRYLKVMEVYND